MPTTFTLGSALGSLAWTIPNLAARHEVERIADIAGLRELWCDASKDAGRFESFSDAGGTSISPAMENAVILRHFA
ncbi:MAG: hypothetical protein WBW81_06815 [Methylocella sp.]